MSILKTPFRYDFVGSFLRPEKLKQAKKDFSEGKITEKELNDITDECVRDIVTKQKAAGFHAITDGEFWILCGDLKALNMRQKVAEFSLTEKLLTLKQLIL